MSQAEYKYGGWHLYYQFSRALLTKTVYIHFQLLLYIFCGRKLERLTLLKEEK